MLPAPHLGASRTRQDPQSKALTAACIVSPSRAGPIGTHMLIVGKFTTLCVFSLCCWSTASHMVLQVQHFLWQSRHKSSSAVISLLCDSHRRCFCVYVYVRFCMHLDAWSVLPQNQYTAAARQQQYNASHVQAFAFVQYSRCMCVVDEQQDTKPRQHFLVQCNNQTHTVGPQTRYTKHTAVAKAVAHTYHGNAHVPPFRHATPPGYQGNPIPEGRPCI